MYTRYGMGAHHYPSPPNQGGRSHHPPHFNDPGFGEWQLQNHMRTPQQGRYPSKPDSRIVTHTTK